MLNNVFKKLSIISLMLFTSCFNSLLIYIDEEKNNLSENVDTVLRKLDYSDFKVIVIPHTSFRLNRSDEEYNFTAFYGSDSDSTYISSEFEGTGFTPNGPASFEGEPPEYVDSQINFNDIPPIYNELEDDGSSYKQFNQRNEYIDTNKRSGVKLDYFSVLVIFEYLEKSQINNLDNILNLSVININRGDKLTITSKN